MSYKSDSNREKSTADLTGALSNDLFRVVSLQQRGATKAAKRFLQEAKRWTGPLSKRDTKDYIVKIAADINGAKIEDISSAQVEKYIRYAVLMQNHTLHAKQLDYKKIVDYYLQRHKTKAHRDQFFLISEKIIDELVAEANISKSDHVLEVGPGLGFITRKLANLAQKVTAIEIDPNFKPFYLIYPLMWKSFGEMLFNC